MTLLADFSDLIDKPVSVHIGQRVCRGTLLRTAPVKGDPRRVMVAVLETEDGGVNYCYLEADDRITAWDRSSLARWRRS